MNLPILQKVSFSKLNLDMIFHSLQLNELLKFSFMYIEVMRDVKYHDVL